jgi:GNAT superfamily N-acetyltransferase
VLGPQDVGHRVVVRRIVGLRDNRPIFTDLLGELTDVSETYVTVVSAGGPVRIPTSEISRAKRVPDRRRLTATEAFERMANAGWPAPEQQPLGDWVLRAADGWTNRANSALATGDPGRPLAAAVDAVNAWYSARGLPPKITVPGPVGRRVSAELQRSGWVPQPVVLVQTAALADIQTTAGSAGSAMVRLDAVPAEPWLDRVGGRKGALPGAARHVLTAVRQVRFAGVYADSGALVALARGAVADDGRWMGLSLLEVVPEQRRRGLARAVTGALADWAASLGAEEAYLQVEHDNPAAVALYARLGFSTRHTYVTWRLD